LKSIINIQENINSLIYDCYNALSPEAKRTVLSEYWSDKKFLETYLTFDNSIHFNTDEGVELYTKASDMYPYSKLIGIVELHNLIAKNTVDNFENCVGVDFLGGSGQVERVITKFTNKKYNGFITGDISIKQILKGIQKGCQVVPCDISNPVTIKDKSLDWALIAYGFHHIAPELRLKSLINAYNKLKPEGMLVLHDGFVGGSTVDIMSKIVDRYSYEPHSHPFLTIEDFDYICDYFYDNYQADVQRKSIFDPQIFFGDSIEELKINFSNYMKSHYYLNLLENEIFDCFLDVFSEYSMKENDINLSKYLRFEEENLTDSSKRKICLKKFFIRPIF